MESKSDKKFQIVANIIMMLLSIGCILPFVLLISSSITDENSLLKNGYSFIPSKISFAVYNYLWAEVSTIFRAFYITILVTIIGTTVSLVITSMLAYPLSRKDLPFKGPL